MLLHVTSFGFLQHRNAPSLWQLLVRAVLWDLQLGDARLCATGSPRSLPGELPAGVWSLQPAASCPDSLQSPHTAPGAGPL